MPVTTKQDIEHATQAAECVVETHFRLAEYLRAGLTLPEIDRFIGQSLADLECRSSFLKYKIPGLPPFPSHACISLNECIVHGTHLMSKEPTKPGDIISIDIGTLYRGWIGDAAWTFAIGEASDEALRLMKSGRESLALGVAAMQPGRPLIDWAKAVQNCVEKEMGFHLVRGLGGHGYGRTLHNPPFISNVMPAYRGEWPDAWKLFEPGMLLAVEPMVAIGTSQTHTASRKWPIYTADDSLSVHYEADVLITEDGPLNLTQRMTELPDIVG